MNIAGQTHPHFTRLFLDLDPAANLIGRGAIAYEDGTEVATLWFHVPAPFEDLLEVWADVLDEYERFVGVQETLF